MKFSIKLPLLFLSLSLVMLGVVTIVSQKGKDILQDTTLTNIEREATLLIRLIERNLFERYHDVQAFRLALGEVDEGRLGFISSSPDFASSLNDLVRNYKVYRRIMVFDLQGNLLAQSTKNQFGKTLPNVQTTAEKVKNSTWFQEAVDGNTLSPDKPESSYVVGPRRFLIDDNPNSFDMIFAALIRDKNGNNTGLWVNVVDFSVVENIVAETYELLSNRGFLSSELTILDNQGRIIVDYDPVGQSKPKYIRDFSIIGELNLAKNGVEGARLAVAGRSGSNISTHFRKQINQVTGYAHTNGAYDYPGLGWSVMIRIAVNEAFYESNMLFRSTFLVSLLLLALIVIVSFYLSKKIARPLRELSYAIKSLANGEKDVILPKVYGQDEIAVMVSELDNLKDIVIEREKLSQETDEQRFLLDIQSKAIDSTTSGIIVSEVSKPDFPIVFTNKAFELLTGYSREEVLGKNCRFLQNDDRDQPGLDKIRLALQNKTSCSVVLRNYRKNGTLFYNNLRIDPVFNEEGIMTHFIGIQTDITDIKRREEENTLKLEQEIERRTQEARESETRLRTVFDTALDGTVVIDAQGKILDINRSTELIFGRVRDDLIGENVSILMPDQYAGEHDNYLNTFLFTGNKKLIGAPRKVKGLHKSGRVFPIEVSVGETKVGDSQVFVGMVKDITIQEEIKRREQALQSELREREIIYRAAFSQAAVGICRVALDGRFIEVNDKMCDIFGYGEQELLEMKLSHVTHPDDQTRSQEMVSALLEGQQRTFTIDKRYINKANETFWATLSVSVVFDEDTRPKYFISVIEDISNRKRIEEELRSAKAARDELLRGMRLASDAGGICNWVLNTHTGHLKWDDNMYALYGIEHGVELNYEHWKQALHPSDADKATHAFEHSLSSKDVFNAEFRIINQSTNQTKWIKAAGDVVLDKESGYEMVFGINLDITDEKDAQAALEKETLAARQANEAKSRFLATMSHEIRTPMNGVVGMVDLLRETELTNDQRKMVSTIRDSSFSLLEIINDILDFSKIESGQVELDLTDVHILHLIEKTAEALWVNAHQKQVGIYLCFETNLPEKLSLDPVRTRQIILNLLGNAIKFTNSEQEIGYVKLIISYREQNLMVTVADNGVGMNSEQVARLFKPFTQADSSTTRKYGGTGLGLSISKSFIELMNGTINVVSEPNKGSQFSVAIPIDSTGSGLLFGQYDLSPYSIVLRIDDQYLQQSIETILSHFNPQSIHVASDQTNGFRFSSKTIVITDQHIDVSGNDAVRYLELDDSPASADGYVRPNKFVVGVHPLKPSELMTGLAVLSGNKSPDFEWSDSFYQDTEPREHGEHQDETSSAVILCAEDQPTNQLVLAQQLKKLGYKYEMTENGKEAFERWMDGEYSLVLTDCHMPEMDGFELTSEVRRVEAELGLERTIIVALTANALVGEAEHCLESGMDDYIAKPVELSTLKKVLSLRLRGKALRDKKNINEHSSTDQFNDLTVEITHDSNLIDYQHLSSVIGSEDKEMQRAVLSMYWDSVTNDFEKIKIAVQKNRPEDIRSLAHGAKGSASSSGVLKLGELFRNLENQHSDSNYTSKKVVEIQAMMKLVETQLKAEKII